MNAMTKTISKFYTDEEITTKYLTMLPLITKTAQIAFAKSDPAEKDEAVQAALAWAWVNLRRLAAEGKLEEACATPIAWFAIRRHRSGRTVGVPSSSTDVMSECCRAIGRSRVKHYGYSEHITDTFESEATATDARYPVDKAVQFKIDFIEGWYQQQTERDRAIIKDLALGETTNDVARKYGVSAGLISQYRKRYAKSWYEFISDKRETPDLIDELKKLVDKEAA